jgi:HSP20 family protein
MTDLRQNGTTKLPLVRFETVKLAVEMATISSRICNTLHYNALSILARLLYIPEADDEKKNSEKGDFEMTKLVVKPNHDLRWNAVDRMFDDMFNFAPGRAANCGCNAPAVNIEESKDDVRLIFEVPGMDKDDIKVTIKERVLTVSGERKEQEKIEDVNYIVSEISSDSFRRSFTLPKTVDTESVTADYRQGLLSVSLDKIPEVKPKEIDISVS